MRKINQAAILGCCALVFAFGAARHKHPSSSSRSTAFDSYLFVLSWSPEYCHGHAGGTQCASDKHFGFVVHGLWPEYATGRGPENCSNAPGLTDPSQLLDIMPDLHLISHEWQTHGTCSGLSADAYFGEIRTLFDSVKIPATYRNVTTQFTTSPSQAAQQFSQVNSNIPLNAIQITCPANYLSEVEICLDKSFHSRACTAPSPCRAQSIKVVPIQ